MASGSTAVVQCVHRGLYSLSETCEFSLRRNNSCCRIVPVLISNRDDDDPKLVCMLRVPHDHCEVVLAAGVRVVALLLQPAEVGLVWVVGLAAYLTLAG